MLKSDREAENTSYGKCNDYRNFGITECLPNAKCLAYDERPFFDPSKEHNTRLILNKNDKGYSQIIYSMYTGKPFTKFQKLMYKICFNITVEDCGQAIDKE